MSYSPSPNSPSSGQPRMQGYQQYQQRQQPGQQQQYQQQQQQQSGQQQQQQYQQQQQQQQQQQHIQSLAVWSPSVPVNASVSPLSSSQAPVLISGPLDLKTRGPHPILPPLKNTLPPPRQNAGPARSASLRRQLSQNGLRQQTSSPSLNQSYNNSNDPENNYSNTNQQQQQQYYPQQDSADSRPPYSPNSSGSSIQYSGYGRGPSSSPGSGSEGGNGSSRMPPLSENDSHLSPTSSPGLSRSNSKINYSSPLLRSHSRSGSNSPSSPASSSPSQSPLKRSTSILKNGPKDAPYLNNNNGTKSHLESLNQTWEPSGPSPALPTGSSQMPTHNGSQHALSQFGSASNLRAKAAAAAAAAASTPSEAGSNTAGDQESKENGAAATTATTTAPGQGPSSTSAFDPATQPALMPHQEQEQKQKDKEFAHNPIRDSENYKVLVPPSPVTSPHIGPSTGSAAHAQAQAGNNFNFLNSDPTLSRSSSRRRMAPPIQVPAAQQPSMPSGGSQSALSPQSQGITSPVSPGRRHPFHRWENMVPPQGHHQHQGVEANSNGHPGPGGPRGYAPNRGQGQGQDHPEDGDHEDEDLNDDTDGDALSGPEDQSRRHHRRQRSAGGDGPFTPTRSAPQPPNFNGGGSGGAPNSREAEMAHIMYIQQQQALFLQEKAMNPPLKNKSSNGNLSGGNSDGSKIRRKGSRHRKQISVISEPKLLSSTNQIKTVPIVRPADQSDNEDAGNKSEYTSGGEGIKNKVRRMRRAVRHAANGVFNDDDSDREDGLGSKSDAEKKGGLKQLKALKSKLAKKLHRPSHGGTSSSRHDHHGGPGGEHGDEEGGRGPVQFFSEDNLRARYLEQQQAGGHSLAAAGASLRRSNTTRENTGAMFNRRDPYGAGDKQEYDSGDEGKDGAIAEESPEAELTPQDAEDAAAAAAAAKKAKMAKFGSRTFDKDEMMEVKDGTGESFFVPRWDLDPRADELGSSKSVISVTSNRKLERSASNATTISTTAVKPVLSISERLQASMITEQDGENVTSDDKVATESKDAGSASVVAENAEGEVTPTEPKKLTWGESTDGTLPADAQADKEAAAVASAESADQVDPNVSVSSSSGLTSRASVMSEASSNASSVAGIVVAQVLTRQNSMRKNFSRPVVGEAKKQQQQEEAQEKSIEQQQQQQVPQQLEDGAASTQMDSPHFGLGISLPSSAAAEKPRESLEEVMADMGQYHGYQGGAPEKQLPPIPQDESPHMKPVAPMTIRPLSPIRRTTANSTASMSSVLSSPSSPPPNHRTISPLDTAAVQQDAEAAQAGLSGNYKYTATVTASSPTSPTKVGSLRSNMSFNAFTLSQGPTSPLPSPSIPTATSGATGGESPAPPASPFPLPAVLARQGSHLTERASIRSMYADSIYDCYDYDSGSEYDAQDPSMLSRQESFCSQFAEQQQQQQEHVIVAESSLVAPIARVPEVVSRAVIEEVVVPRSIGESPVVPATTSTTTTATAMAPSKTETESVATVVVSLNKEDEQTQTQVPESVETGSTTSNVTTSISGSEEVPVIRLRGAAAVAAASATGENGQNRDSQALKEEHHILFEDIPKAVPYRMSMMTTVPVDPVGVAASLSVPLLAAGGIAGVTVAGAGPSRPTRNPMRQSRHGSMLSIGGSSDLTTTDSWMSSSVRDTRDDMSGWDIRGEHHRPETVDENESVRRISLSGSSRSGDDDDQDGERARRPSVDSFMTSSSLASSAFQARRRSSVRSERTMSIMTDKSSLILEEEGSGSSDESDNENSIAHRDLKIRIKGLDSSSGTNSDSEDEHVTGLKDGESPEGSVIRHKKQWYKERRTSASKRETWGSIQSSSSSDSNTTSSSSSGSSHSNFYFNGRSPSPSPTEESAAASSSAKPF